MSKGEQRHPGGRTHVWLAEVLVVLLLGSAVAVDAFDLNTRWFGDTTRVRAPNRVLPPEGVELPAAGAAPPVAAALRGGTVSERRVAAAVAPYIGKKMLGRRMVVEVAQLSDGKVVHRSGPRTITPASTNKLLTTSAALLALGPGKRFRTTVRYSPSRHRVILVGGGDPLLASSPKVGRATWPHRADLSSLAADAAAALRKRGVKAVRLSYDDSLFTGPRVSPDWPPGYIPDGVVPPITALWVDEGLDPTGYGVVEDPPVVAARTFAFALERAGIRVVGRPQRGVATRTDRELTGVASPPLGQIVEYTLATSDNSAAEVIGHHVGLAVERSGSFAGGVRGVRRTLTRVGVPFTGDRLFDGSGLSRKDRLSPDTLVAVVRAAASGRHPVLGQILSGVPVAGFSGSLAYRFDNGPAYGRGRVRAKTGTLTGVHGLAGLVTDRQGDQMVFVAIADRVPYIKQMDARQDIDQLAAALAACRCRASGGS